VVLSFGNSSKWWCLLFSILQKDVPILGTCFLSGIEIPISLSEPSVESVFAYQIRTFWKGGVDFNNSSRDWGIHIAHSFHTLHTCEFLTLFAWWACFWQLHKH
jgi:hypothetical protein